MWKFIIYLVALFGTFHLQSCPYDEEEEDIYTLLGPKTQFLSEEVEAFRARGSSIDTIANSYPVQFVMSREGKKATCTFHLVRLSTGSWLFCTPFSLCSEKETNPLLKGSEIVYLERDPDDSTVLLPGWEEYSRHQARLWGQEESITRVLTEISDETYLFEDGFSIRLSEVEDIQDFPLEGENLDLISQLMFYDYEDLTDSDLEEEIDEKIVMKIDIVFPPLFKQRETLSSLEVGDRVVFHMLTFMEGQQTMCLIEKEDIFIPLPQNPGTFSDAYLAFVEKQSEVNVAFSHIKDVYPLALEVRKQKWNGKNSKKQKKVQVVLLETGQLIACTPDEKWMPSLKEQIGHQSLFGGEEFLLVTPSERDIGYAYNAYEIATREENIQEKTVVSIVDEKYFFDDGTSLTKGDFIYRYYKGSYEDEYGGTYRWDISWGDLSYSKEMLLRLSYNNCLDLEDSFNKIYELSLPDHLNPTLALASLQVGDRVEFHPYHFSRFPIENEDLYEDGLTLGEGFSLLFLSKKK